jgi:hypothetical protein
VERLHYCRLIPSWLKLQRESLAIPISSGGFHREPSISVILINVDLANFEVTFSVRMHAAKFNDLKRQFARISLVLNRLVEA